jgi:iron complex outermembrane receptor protein
VRHYADKSCLGSAASAREADPSENARRADAEIIVTGLRPDEGQNKVSKGGALGAKALLDTPYSVTIVDADDIARRQANSIALIFANDPSVYSSAPSGSTNWWGTQIRGLGVRNYYIDDVPLLLYWGGDFPLEPIESVTALKAADLDGDVIQAYIVGLRRCRSPSGGAFEYTAGLY